jgi:hypothetical protein
VRCKELYVRGGGIGIADFTGNLHYHLEEMVDIYLDSAGAIGIQQNAAGNSGIATVQHIVEIDGPHAGTIGVQVNAGTLNLICNEISADTAWDVASDATLNLIGCTATGAKTGIANATIADTPQSNRNTLINGGMAIWQRYADPSVAASIDDADYAADRWKVLSSSGSNTTTAARIAGDTTPYACRLTQTSATARRIGMVQFIEGQDCQHLRGQQIAVQTRVRCSAAATIKIGVLQWAGTEDQPTNDPVASWAATPTWAASYSLAGSGSVALAASTWSDLRATFTLNSSFNNLAIIVWSSDALAQNATLDLSAIQHERGATATPFEVRPVAAELALCQRYFQRLGGGSVFEHFAVGFYWDADTAFFVMHYPTKRDVPTITFGPTVSDFEIVGPGLRETATSLSLSYVTPSNVRVNMDTAIQSAGLLGFFRANGTLAAFIDIDGEL